MTSAEERAVAIVGFGAILPDAPDVATFWANLKAGKDSIGEVPKERWDPDFYWDPDPAAPDRSYSKIGGWVRDWAWEPAKWKLPIPPKVADAMDPGQKWAISCARAAMQSYGKPVDGMRTAVILGNAMAGERHLFTTLRLLFPEFAKALQHAKSFTDLPAEVRAAIERDARVAFGAQLPAITEDSMPGELSNCLAGRVANLFDLHGPNFTVDAACASSLAALNASIEGLIEGEFDAALCGGIDRNMGVNAFVKFCKIGALSATGSRPYSDGADGFVMGEGAALFLLKRLADAERDGDRVHAVVRAVGASSDGKGKGLTAPNPIGQKLAIERAWKTAGLDPSTCGMVEGHGTSTKVGDLVEVQSLIDTFHKSNGSGPIALGSVKSNFGHLKAAAGAAGLLKATLSLREKVIPPSLHCERTNPAIDFDKSPFHVQRELGEFPQHGNEPRRAAVSAFGFGGTNFHIVLEEHVPGRLARKRPVPVPELPKPSGSKAALRGLAVTGAATVPELVAKLRELEAAAKRGQVPAPGAPAKADLRAQERVAIDFAEAKDLAEKAGKAAQALEGGDARAWKVLRNKGVFRGSGPAPKVAFLCTGQGSQYVGMLRALREREPVVRETFAEADAAMAALLEKPLSEYIFADPKDPKSEEALKQTAITQPAVLTVDIALARLLGEYGIKPDFVMGHSLGEYAALVCAGALPFADALEAVSARGREMTRLSMKDNGAMAAVGAPLAKVEEALSRVKGYVVIANLNSRKQAVIGGETQGVEDAIQELARLGHGAVKLPVSHAFHTRIVAPASEPLRRVLQRLHLQAPQLPVIANVTGELYPEGHEAMLDLLARQVASPVQFVKGLETLYAKGARVFVEVGPKRALQGFVDDVLESPDVLALSTNHPKQEDALAFNQALAGLFAAGLGRSEDNEAVAPRAEKPALEPVVITGAALGLPGGGPLFDDANVGRILRGEQMIDLIPARFRRAMVDKHVVRVVKGEDGSGSMQAIESQSEVIKLAGRGAALDLAAQFGIPAERVAAFDRATALAIGAGLEALRDAGIPLVLRWKTTSRGTRLPDRLVLPEEMRDDTGVIFASAFPGFDSFAQILTASHRDLARREELARSEQLLARCGPADAVKPQIEERIEELKGELLREPFAFDRRFLFRILSMGHSQFAELIGARGPNTQVNAACASTTLAVGLAEDWIRAGRCRRVIVLAGDDATSDNLLEWIGAGFLASGAAATDDDVELAATPFDRRRHGMIVGMGAAALIVEGAEAARERGLLPIAQVLGAEMANSAYHGSRLDVEHIAGAMERLVSGVEKRSGLSRAEMARSMVFLSHETYTPARGGSASAEVYALRQVFGGDADRIVIANTKGFTGHAMAVGLEDVVAVKALETGLVPPIPNFKEKDPELGDLNLSRGGSVKPEFALRLAAGFGSQLALTLERRGTAERRPPEKLGYEGRIQDQAKFDAWIARASGQPKAQLEVVHRILRIRDNAAPREIKPEAAPPPKPAAVIVPQAAKAAAPSIAKPAVAPLAPAAKPAPAPVAKLAAVPAAPAVAAPAVQPAKVADGVAEKVLEIIAAKTGYPPEMLDLDLDLEADLGVDTVKQAETFASVREAYGIEREAQLKLRDFPTLRHVIGFVYDRKPELRAASPAATPAKAPEPQPAPAPEPQTAPAAVAAPAATAQDGVAQKVMEIIAAKTGYPPEMLDLDLDLEADLGVDTVKQAETFASVREAYGIEREAQLKLRDFPTLRHVIGFVYDRKPELRPAQPAPAAVKSPEPQPVPAPEPQAVPAPAAPAAAAAQGEVDQKVLEIIAAKTGYPPEMLDLDLDLEADLGVDTVKQAEMFASVREAYSIERDAQLKLRDFPTLRHVIGFVYDRRPDLRPAAPAAAAPDPAAEPAPAPAVIPALTQPAAPAEAAIPAVPQAVAAAPAGEVPAKVLAILAEKTGYPPEMLDLDLDLEADLGVDTVKQAETFAAVREAYGIERDAQLKLRDFPTIRHVIQFVYDRRPVAASAPAASAATAELAPEAPATTILRRIPVPILRPPIALCKDTGVKLNRVAIVADASGVAEALAQQLRARGAEVLVVDPKDFSSSADVDGLFWLPALDDEGALFALTPQGWQEGVARRVKSLASVARVLHPQLTKGRFLIAGTRMGGLLGAGPDGASAPMGGAVSGFVKALARECAEALIKVVDFEQARTPEAIASALIEEALYDPGAVEIGRRGEVRFSLAAREAKAGTGTPAKLGRDAIFVITGAAGSIVSAITCDLAKGGGSFWLLDRFPEPDLANPDLEKIGSDRDGLKRSLIERAQARGEKVTPVAIERELAGLERLAAGAQAIRAIQAAGGTAHWAQADLCDAKAVESALAGVPRADVLLHCAGLEISRFLPDKSDEEFARVLDVKANGFFHVLHALRGVPIGAVVTFGSIAGRFGNAGQTDYSAANDLLAKCLAALRRERPEIQGVHLDWTAWARIGMASRGSIPKMMEVAGIEMLPPEEGLRAIRRELAAGTRGEVIVAGALGVLLDERDPDGGLDAEKLDLSGRGPMIGRVVSLTLHGGLTVETTLDPKNQPFLHDHQINGTPVLPGVMGVEAFAELATLLAPGFRVAAVEHVEFLAPFKFYRGEPRALRLSALLGESGGDLVAECALIGERKLLNQEAAQRTIHFTARVRLARKAAEQVIAKQPLSHEVALPARDIYGVYFHGPAYQVLERAWSDNGSTVGLLPASLPEDHAAGRPLVLDPRLIELCFQTAGLREMRAKGQMGLPQSVAQVETLGDTSEAHGRLEAVVVDDGAGGFDAQVVDEAGRALLRLHGYRTVALRAPLDQAFLERLATV